MATPFNAAATAYGNAAKLLSQAVDGPPETLNQGGEGPDFAKMLASSVQSVVDSGRSS